ncbi:MAG: hypothetical protein Q9195_007790 [Heterodermia aff. obscurata]
MDTSFDVSDPSDWLETPVKELAAIETALRCQVCKDFFDTPMITSCSHTFCSLCIRRCLTTDGKCPACRASDQELRLRRNWTVEELVEGFKRAREALLRFNQSIKAIEEENAQGNHKRKRNSTSQGLDEAMPSTSRRKTRSQRREAPETHVTSPNEVADTEEDDDYQPDDGLTACPICGKRMKEAEVFPHLDVHNEPVSTSNGILSPTRKTPVDMTSRSRQPSKPMERLPQLSYGLLKEQALRKKLSELGIPGHGPKPLLIKRHTEWVNLVNANCDSSRPRTKRELLNELDVWERSQGRNILNGLSGNEASVMRKDFDGAAWATNHERDFQDLIAKARRKPPAHKEGHGVDGVNRATETNQRSHSPTSMPQITGDSQVEMESTLKSPSNLANGTFTRDIRVPTLEEKQPPAREPVIDLSDELESHSNTRPG